MQQYEGLRMLQKPRLRASVSIISSLSDTLMVKDGKRLFTLKGRIVPLLQSIRVLLDGQRDLEAIIQALPNYRAADIVKTLEVLQTRGLLEDASIAPPPPLMPEEVGRYETQMAFFSQSTLDRFEPQCALKTAKVVILGLGDIGVRVLAFLGLSGVGEIDGVDWRQVEETDVFSGALYRAEDLHQSKATAAQQRVAELNPYVKYTGVEAALHTAEDARALIRGKTLAILCLDGPAPGLLQIVNEACLAEGVAWTSARLEDDEGIVGPSVIPRVTPCYKCFELRLKANLSRYEEYIAYEKHLIDAEDAHDSYPPRLHPAAAILAGYLALEAIKLLTKVVEPALLGQIYILNFLSLETSLHEILKLPRCPACSLTRQIPSQKAWNV